MEMRNVYVRHRVLNELYWAEYMAPGWESEFEIVNPADIVRVIQWEFEDAQKGGYFMDMLKGYNTSPECRILGILKEIFDGVSLNKNKKDALLKRIRRATDKMLQNNGIARREWVPA